MHVCVLGGGDETDGGMKPMHVQLMADAFNRFKRGARMRHFSSFTIFFLSLSGVLSAQKLHTADTRMTGAKSQEEGQEKGVNDRLSIPVLLSTCGYFQLDVD